MSSNPKFRTLDYEYRTSERIHPELEIVRYSNPKAPDLDNLTYALYHAQGTCIVLGDLGSETYYVSVIDNSIDDKILRRTLLEELSRSIELDLISQKIRKVTGASTTKALYLAARLGFQDKKG